MGRIFILFDYKIAIIIAIIICSMYYGVSTRRTGPQSFPSDYDFANELKYITHFDHLVLKICKTEATREHAIVELTPPKGQLNSAVKFRMNL